MDEEEEVEETYEEEVPQEEEAPEEEEEAPEEDDALLGEGDEGEDDGGEYTEVTEETWGSRMGNACCGVMIGFLLFFSSFPVLVWNEGRSIKRMKSLKEANKLVVSVPSDKIDPKNEGKLVHVTGNSKAGSHVEDSFFHINPGNDTLKLQRYVEMYQWVEKTHKQTKKKHGKKVTTKTYSYDKEWKSSVVSSSSFKKSGHNNPSSMPFEQMTDVSDPITLGAFTLSEEQVNRINWYESYPIDNSNFPSLDAQELSTGKYYNATIDEGRLYFGQGPSGPAIGDTRVTFSVVKSGPLSVISEQVQNTFGPYVTKVGGTISLLESGTKSSSAMIQNAKDSEKLVVFLVRLAGFLMMFVGIVLVGNVASVLVDIIPFLGDILSTVIDFGVMLVALVVSVVLSSITIAIAWLAFRPLWALSVLLIMGGIIYGITRLVGSRKKVKDAGTYEKIGEVA